MKMQAGQIHIITGFCRFNECENSPQAGDMFEIDTCRVAGFKKLLKASVFEFLYHANGVIL